jgi:hypothetical protein
MMHFLSAPKVVDTTEHPALAELSKREMEILERIAEGE